MQPADDKYAELVLYVAWRTEHKPKFGAVKLNKVLFYADFESYRERGSSITNATYMKREHGPMPRRIEVVKADLLANGSAIERQEPAGSYQARRFVPLRRANLALFDAWEIDLVDRVIEEVSKETASQVSKRTHRLDGWKFADMLEDIPYETAFLPDEAVELTDAEVEYGRQVAARMGAAPPKT